jgi:hypothetical protein
MTFDYTKITNVQIDSIDMKDSPKFVDAFIASADYDGRPMTDSELDVLNEDTDYIHEQVFKYLY